MYGGPTPKRHVLWANSPVIQRLHTGALKGWSQFVKAKEASGQKHVRTVQKYTNKEGRQCWKGDAGLKPSESETYFFKKNYFDQIWMVENRLKQASQIKPVPSFVVPETPPVAGQGTILKPLAASWHPCTMTSTRTSSVCLPHHRISLQLRNLLLPWNF